MLAGHPLVEYEEGTRRRAGASRARPAGTRGSTVTFGQLSAFN